MAKSAAALFGATLSSGLGAALHVRAYAPTLVWAPAWVGAADPAVEGGLLLTGVFLMATGPAVFVVAAHRWLSARDRYPFGAR